MKNEAIICVDDEAIILMAMKRELKAHFLDRFRFETALDAEDGLEVIRELIDEGVSVILVISDWLMPGMKGDEFLSVVRAQHPSVRTVMVSGQTDEDSVALLRENGTLDAFIRKPWNTARLVAECRRLLGEDGFAP